MHTQLAYFENTEQYESTALAQLVIPSHDRYNIILDQTIFYPQGGGQPYDTGTIEGPDGVFAVQEVRMFEDTVHHYGIFRTGTISDGQTVKLSVNKERRTLHARLHSAGHLIDVALANIGMRLEPTKGYHFPEGPYVEYNGTIAEEERDTVQKNLEEELTRLVALGNDVTTQYAKKEELLALCGVVPDYINEDKPIRVITLSGNLGYPCGGTHVKNVRAIGKITITKIKSKGGTVRISYALD